MRKQKRPGYLRDYAQHVGISSEAMRRQLERLGVNYMQPFDWDEIDALRNSTRHLARDPYRKSRLR
jgi:hypothetical protein